MFLYLFDGPRGIKLAFTYDQQLNMQSVFIFMLPTNIGGVAELWWFKSSNSFVGLSGLCVYARQSYLVLIQHNVDSAKILSTHHDGVYVSTGW